MPGGRRTDRINARDLEVLEFIARYGTVPRGAVATWAASGRSVGFERERRLRLAGLIVVRRGFADAERLLAATALGLRVCGRGELRAARPSPATIRHEAVLAQLGAVLERRGARLLSEREILALERAEGRRLFSATLADGRFHRADLLRLAADGAPPEAIEVELSTKGAARLDALLRAWRFAVAERRLSRVVYHCSPRSRRFVEQAIERTRTEAMIAVVALEL
jgi:hypothetical protein